MNSREKGKRGERELAAFLTEHGFPARRGQQFAGGPESPDVVCKVLDKLLHMECKRTERLNLRDACAQAAGDSKGKPWVVFYRWNNGPWLAITLGEKFLDAISGRLAVPTQMQGEENLTTDKDGTTPQPDRAGRTEYTDGETGGTAGDGANEEVNVERRTSNFELRKGSQEQSLVTSAPTQTISDFAAGAAEKASDQVSVVSHQ